MAVSPKISCVLIPLWSRTHSGLQVLNQWVCGQTQTPVWFNSSIGLPPITWGTGLKFRFFSPTLDSLNRQP